MALNKRQEVFCQQVAKGITPTEAARGAGYSGSGVRVTASRMMDKPEIVERIAAIKTTVERATVSRVAIDKAWVISQLVENVETAKQAVPVLDREGNETGDYVQNLVAANKALELIGKELGMFVERREVRTGPLFADLTDEQLDAALAAARALAEAAGEAHGAGEGRADRDQSAQVVPALREAG